MSEVTRRETLLNDLTALLNLALPWAEAHEAHIMAHGAPLSPSELTDARRAGVRRPENIRLLVVDAVPLPADPMVQAAVKRLDLTGPATHGLALGFGIQLRGDQRNDRLLLVHLFVHVAQFEQVGTSTLSLAQFLIQCAEHGRMFAPLEIQACEKAEMLVAEDLVQEESGTIHWRHFIQYMEDAVHFALDASRLPGDTRENKSRQERCTRSAIIQCALALEAVANCLVNGRSTKKFSLPDNTGSKTLAKFDLFLSKSPDKRVLDTSHPLVAPIVSLIKCRNAYVHSQGVTENFSHSALELSYWDPLGLPKNSQYWQPVHAIKTLTVLSDFLNFFFFDICGLKEFGPNGRAIPLELLSSWLLASDGKKLPAGVTRATIREGYLECAITAEREWGLEFNFLGYLGASAAGTTSPKREWGDYSHCRLDDFGVPFQWIWYSVPNGFGVIKTRALARSTST